MEVTIILQPMWSSVNIFANAFSSVHSSCIMMPFAWLGSFCELCLEKLFRWFWAAASVVTAIRTLGLELFSIDITLRFGVI